MRKSNHKKEMKPDILKKELLLLLLLCVFVRLL